MDANEEFLKIETWEEYQSKKASLDIDMSREDVNEHFHELLPKTPRRTEAIEKGWLID